ncbi:MAG TPA: D-alanyl-D-alanine carboxypeptidase, partial [Ruminococcaceae bacterium]|nr:D-alanyl-D-alanine carboxypeptidase [Oscillospiraceae bacterium]HCB91198.1 D-alanyl-D-alanine carboxypeptidase [Oscillospiraceae bacterium]
PEKSYSALLPKEVSPSSVIVTKNTPKSVDAPVREGQAVGTATFSYANQKLATVKLVAAESVERSELLHTTDMVRVLVTSPWFVLVVAIILVLLAVYIVLAVLYNRRRKKLRKVKRYRRM